MKVDLNDPSEVDALVELWQGTPEGAALWPLMWKWAKACDNHMPGWKWFAEMKKSYIQVMQWHLRLTVSEDESTDEPEKNCSIT